MDKIRVRGGARLSGQVRVSGSKNASLPILAACLLVDGPTVLEGVPRLEDVRNMCHILEHLGVVHEWLPDGSLRVEVVDDRNVHAPYHYVRTMRASFCLLGPLWARRGRAQVSHPGGCVFGHRPIDLHLKGMRALGADIRIDKGDVHASGPVRGGRVYLGSNFGSTVLGTANTLMAACLAEGETVIEYAAQEPEIADLCRFLRACGARIEGIGTHRLHIRGVPKLRGCRYRVINDRIEAGTLLAAGVLTGGEVEVLGAEPDHLSAFLDALERAGARFEIGFREPGDGAGAELGAELPGLVEARPPRVSREGRALRLPRTGEQGGRLLTDRIFYEDERRVGDGPGEEGIPFLRTLPMDPEELEATDVATMPYPGFPTDLQAQFMALMLVAKGVSVITEKIYPERFIHVSELARLGARIRREGPCAIVQGGRELCGATVMASDLRASAALILAGLVARGTTAIRRVYHLDRGYESLDRKLAALGADIVRLKEV